MRICVSVPHVGNSVGRKLGPWKLDRSKTKPDPEPFRDGRSWKRAMHRISVFHLEALTRGQTLER